MPKLKTNSSAKKRFVLTSSGKVRAPQAGKQHKMRHRSKDKIRELRGTAILDGTQAKNLKRFFMPYV